MESVTSDLSKRADRGDKEALRELFVLAERYQEEGKLNEAIAAYRDSAIAYRISAFRNLARAEDAEASARWHKGVCLLYRDWIETNPDGVRKPPLAAPQLSRESVVEVVNQLRGDPSFAFHFAYLQATLEALGVPISSPGASVWRHVTSLLWCLFGLVDSVPSHTVHYDVLLDEAAVRVSLDPIADLVIQFKRPK